METQLALGAFSGVFANSTAIDSAGIIAQVFEDVKVNTWDQELGLLHVDVESITFHASLPCLELEDIVLQHVCDEHQVVTAFTMKADWNLLTVAGSLSFQVQIRGENLLSSLGGMWAVISYTSYQMLVFHWCVFSPLELQILSLIDRWRHQRDHQRGDCLIWI